MMHRSLIMAGAAILAFASVAWAHDVVEGVGTQTIITFSGGKVFIDFNVGYSPTAGYETAKKFDRDGNLKLSEEELRTLVEDLKCQVPSRIELSLDGEPVKLTFRRVHHLTFRPGRFTYQQYDVWLLYEGDLPALDDSPHTVVYKDRVYEKERTVELVRVRIHAGVEFASVPRSLNRNVKASSEDGKRSGYILKSGSVAVEIRASGDASTPVPGSQEPVPEEPPALREGIDGTIKRLLNEENVWVYLLGILLSAFYGAWHAFTPGHGKTMVAAYLIGTKGRMRDALMLGLTVTFSHTGIILVAAIIIHHFSEQIFGSMPEAHNQLVLYTSVISGSIIFVMGFYLFYRRVGKMGHEHSHGLFGHSHPELPEGHEQNPPHQHDAVQHAPSSSSDSFDGPKKKSLLFLGISGGMVPCPAALWMILFFYGALQDTRAGLVFLLAFSVGLGFVLTGIGVVLVLSKKLMASVAGEKRFFQRLPLLKNTLGVTLDRLTFRLLPLVPAGSALFLMFLGVLIISNVLFKMKVL